MAKATSRARVQITSRDVGLLQSLHIAGWLSTHQIRDRFFPGRSANAVCKRLRKLVAGKYVGVARTGSTEQALYRLAREGRLVLSEQTELEAEEISIPTEVPRKLDHFMAINDLRFAFEKLKGEQGASLIFFSSERELASSRFGSTKEAAVIAQLASAHRIIPDGLARVSITKHGTVCDLDVAVEFDAGSEHVGFFGRTKVVQYAALATRHQDWLADFKVLTFAPSVKRIVALMRQVVAHRAPRNLFYFAPVGKLNGHDWGNDELFLDPYDFFVPAWEGDRSGVIERAMEGSVIPQHALVDLPAGSPHDLSRRGESSEQE